MRKRKGRRGRNHNRLYIWTIKEVIDIIYSTKDFKEKTMSLIKGIHHVSMKCSSTEEYEKTIDFYKNILGIPVIREWQAGIMLDTGNGIVEIFNDGDDAPGKGVIRHFAFATDNVDACVESVKAAEYEVFIEPKDIEIASTPAFPARIAFCKGPLGEEIELFEEK